MFNRNISLVDDIQTANTDSDVAFARAQRLLQAGAKHVFELCVGPSLRVLEHAYKSLGMKCSGKDIDCRWADFYPEGQWFIGDCFGVERPEDADVIVFAPPLSRGCSGCREDALCIDQVVPPYTDFVSFLTRRSCVASQITSHKTRPLSIG